MTETPTPDPGDGTSRRTLLRGAAVGGAALWVVPVVQAVDMTAASAQTASPTATATATSTPTPTPTPTQTTAATYAGPSHGLLAFRLPDGLYVAKVDKDGKVGKVNEQAGNADVTFLKSAPQAYTGWKDGSFVSGGRSQPVAGRILSLYLDVPAGATDVRAWTSDGSLGGVGLGYVPAVPVAGRVTFAL